MNRRKFFRTAAAIAGTGSALPVLAKLDPDPSKMILWTEILMPLDAAYSFKAKDYYGEWSFVTGSDLMRD